jgi:hypothetical protein
VRRSIAEARAGANWSYVRVIAEKLKKEKLVEKPADKWTLTQAGKDKVKAVKAARESRSNRNL